MATKSDVMKERQRYRIIRLVLLCIFLLSFAGWLYYADVWIFFTEPGRKYFFDRGDYLQGILLTLEWLFCINILPICAPDTVKNYWLYATIFSGFSLHYYLRHLASFKCPFCRKVIEVDSTWQCPSCDHVLTRPLWYTIFHKCKWRKCKETPEAYDCPRCGRTIHLLSPAPQLRSVSAGGEPSEHHPRVARFPGAGS
jgi:DNA-directed RNA polymerase subunit RPC12/RpoP